MRALMALAAGFCLAGSPARADCPDWLVADMVARSVPSYEIGRMCGPPATRSIAPGTAAPAAPAARRREAAGGASAPRPRSSTRCVTDASQGCMTGTPRAQGSPCWCDVPGGFVEGTIR